MADREEMLAEAKRRQLLLQAKAIQARKKAPAVEAAPARGATTGLDDTIGTGLSFLSGATSGFADEVFGGVRAAADNLLGGGDYDFGEGMVNETQSAADKYAMFRDDLRDRKDEFADAHGGLALGAEMVGSFMNPLNKVAPGMGLSKARTGKEALQRAGAVTARGAAEGALTGLGEGRGTLEEQLQSAGTGAKWGGGLGGALSLGGGAVGRAVANRKIRQSLDQKDGSFIPIQLADREGLLGDLYRNTLGRVWGAKGMLQEQEKDIARLAHEGVETAQTGVATTKAAIAGERAGVKQGLSEEVERVAEEARAAKEIADRVKREAIASADAEKIAMARTIEQQADDFIAESSESFRRQAAAGGLPDDVAPRFFENLDPADHEAVAGKMKDWWNNDAFDMVKSRNFDWDAGLKGDIAEMLAGDANLALYADEAIPRINKAIEKLQKAGGTGKQLASAADLADNMLAGDVVGIDGDALMEIRNIFAKAGNKTTDADKRRAYGAIKNRFDDLIRKQLDAKGAEQYSDQLSKYTAGQAYIKSVDDALFDLDGKFTPAGYNKNSKKYGGGQSQLTGKAPLTQEARAARRTEQAVTRGVKDASPRVRERVAGLKQAARAENRRQTKRIGQRKRATENRLSRQAEGAIDEVDVASRRSTAAGALVKARRALKETNRARVPKGSSGLSSLLTTGAIGSALLGPAAVLPTLATGVAAGKVLASKPGQRFMAGQTGWQRKLAEALRKGDTAEYARILARQGALSATGD